MALALKDRKTSQDGQGKKDETIDQGINGRKNGEKFLPHHRERTSQGEVRGGVRGKVSPYRPEG